MAANSVALRLPNPARIRAWINRLPFFTRGILLLVVLSSIAGLIVPWIIPASALIPSQVSIFAGILPSTLMAGHWLTSLFSIPSKHLPDSPRRHRLRHNQSHPSYPSTRALRIAIRHFGLCRTLLRPFRYAPWRTIHPRQPCYPSCGYSYTRLDDMVISPPVYGSAHATPTASFIQTRRHQFANLAFPNTTTSLFTFPATLGHTT